MGHKTLSITHTLGHAYTSVGSLFLSRSLALALALSLVLSLVLSAVKPKPGVLYGPLTGERQCDS